MNFLPESGIKYLETLGILLLPSEEAIFRKYWTEALNASHNGNPILATRFLYTKKIPHVRHGSAAPYISAFREEAIAERIALRSRRG
jgi:hypothetical protein